MTGTVQTPGWPLHCIRGQQRGQRARRPQDKGGKLASWPRIPLLCASADSLPALHTRA